MIKPIKPRWRKVGRDIWRNKTRTVLVVLSIAVGVFAIGMVAGTRVILARAANESWMATNPPSALLFTDERFDQDQVEVVRSMRQVSEAEAWRQLTLPYKLTEEAEWRSLDLIVLPDYKDMRLSIVRPEQGAWPPPKHQLLVERASLDFMQASIGEAVIVKTTEDKERVLRLAGTVYHLYASPYLGGNPTAYITIDTLEWLGETRDFNQLKILVAGDRTDTEHIQAVTDDVRRKVEKSEIEVMFTVVPTPGEHPVNEILEPLLLMLGSLGAFSLLLSGFLVVNTVSALLTQQIRQIGMMKAIGARRSQLFGMYFVMVIIFGLLSLGVAVPLGAAGARGLTNLFASYLNFDVGPTSLPPQVLALEVGVGLIVPLLAAAYPIIAGTRITVHEAISAYGLGKGVFGSGRIDRLLISFSRRKWRLISRPLAISLRNAFRRKTRLTLTLVTLTLAGAIFVAIFSVRDSLLLTLDDALKYWQFDVGVSFEHSERIKEVERVARQVPGVAAVEGWGFKGVRRLRPDGSEGDNMVVVAPPAETVMLQPTLLEGRWLQSGDTNALVINSDLHEDEADLKIGDEVCLKFGARETSWQIVGVVQGVLSGPIAYANYPHFAHVTRAVGQVGGIQIVSKDHGPVAETELGQALEERFEQAGISVSAIEKISEARTRVEFLFNLIVFFMLVMAILLAVVGGLGLMGTMSINVLERTREIGVMRAVGASNGAIFRVIIVEGIVIGLLSWLLGATIAFPVSKMLSSQVGVQLLGAPLSYSFSTSGTLIWLVVVISLSALASFLPARGATRLTVREVLAYE